MKTAMMTFALIAAYDPNGPVKLAQYLLGLALWAILVVVAYKGIGSLAKAAALGFAGTALMAILLSVFASSDANFLKGLGQTIIKIMGWG